MGDRGANDEGEGHFHSPTLRRARARAKSYGRATENDYQELLDATNPDDSIQES
jgi:hypothetical protein